MSSRRTGFLATRATRSASSIPSTIVETDSFAIVKIDRAEQRPAQKSLVVQYNTEVVQADVRALVLDQLGESRGAAEPEPDQAVDGVAENEERPATITGRMSRIRAPPTGRGTPPGKRARLSCPKGLSTGGLRGEELPGILGG